MTTNGVELTPDRPLGRFSELGTRAELAGFDAAFVSCHYFNRDPFVALDRIARATDDLRLGPGVANPHEHHPVALAARVASLDEVSHGRALLGIGPGDPSTLRALGLADERDLRSVLETIRAARTLWAGDPLTHEGRFEAAAAELKFDPPSGAAIPAYVGGEGPDMCRMAAKHADGLLYNGSHPDDLSWARDRVAEGLADRPDDRGPFELVAYASVSVAEDGAAAREAARPAVAFIAGGAPRPVLDRHGIDADRAGEIADAVAGGNFERAYGLVTPAMIDAFCAAGTPDAVAGRLAGLGEHADGVVVGSPLGPDPERAIDLAGTALDRSA